MKRYTEYHNGVAVIKDKALMKDAMAKLAKIEDEQDNSKEYRMEEITTEMAEYICDMCCGNLDDVGCQEDADEICAECKLGKFICDICNEYDSINTFVGSAVEKQMMKNIKLKEELQNYKDLEERGLLLRLPCKENEWVWIAHETRKCAYKVLYTCKSDILADMEEGYVFGYTKAEAEKALEEMEN